VRNSGIRKVAQGLVEITRGPEKIRRRKVQGGRSVSAVLSKENITIKIPYKKGGKDVKEFEEKVAMKRDRPQSTTLRRVSYKGRTREVRPLSKF